jgi:hypothetical protein
MEKVMGFGEYSLACFCWNDGLLTESCSEHGSGGRSSWPACGPPLARHGKMVSAPGREDAEAHAAAPWVVVVVCPETFLLGGESGCGLALLGCSRWFQTSLWPGIVAGVALRAGSR